MIRHRFPALIQRLAVAVADARDDMRQDALAAIGERGVGSRKLQERHLGSAERNRRLSPGEVDGGIERYDDRFEGRRSQRRRGRRLRHRRR